METKDMLYLVTEYASNGEMFGECWIECIEVQLHNEGSIDRGCVSFASSIGWGYIMCMKVDAKLNRPVCVIPPRQCSLWSLIILILRMLSYIQILRVNSVVSRTWTETLWLCSIVCFELDYWSKLRRCPSFKSKVVRYFLFPVENWQEFSLLGTNM